MRLKVTDRCQGHMQCILVAPDLFVIDDEFGHAHEVAEIVPADQEHAARRAVLACPERAIEISDD